MVRHVCFRWLLCVGALLTVAAVPLKVFGNDGRPSAFVNRYKEFLFGVCYYPEQWPESYWEEDARRMKECGVNTVRLGEFGWAIMEPRPGHYDFALFDRAIELEAGLLSGVP